MLEVKGFWAPDVLMQRVQQAPDLPAPPRSSLLVGSKQKSYDVAAVGDMAAVERMDDAGKNYLAHPG